MKSLFLKMLVYTTFIAFISCDKPLPAFSDVDLKIWNEDKGACLGKRAGMEDALQRQKEKFIGLTEMQVVTLLGRPDHNELYKRNQKFYYYLIQPSKDCGTANTENPRELTIRFTAMGIANEVSIE